MNWNELLVNAEVIGNIVGVVLGFVLGLIISYFTQRKSEQRERSQITYSTDVNLPLEIAQEELKGKLVIFYGKSQINKLYFSTVDMVNSGSLTIREQTFTCLFPEHARQVDPAFPRISTVPEREVGPVEQDLSIHSPHEYRYTIDALGVGQKVKIEFLTIENESTDLGIHFRPNPHKEIEFVEGEISESPTLALHVRHFVMGIAFYILAIQISSALPFVGRFFGVALGLPFLFRALRELPYLIPSIVGLLQQEEQASTNTTHVHGTVRGPVHAGSGDITIRDGLQYPQSVVEEEEEED